MPKHLTIRDIPEDLAAALEAERRRRGASLNRTVKELLGQALGVGGAPFDNGLGRHAGTWSDAELRQFEEATAVFEAIDEELWR